MSHRWLKKNPFMSLWLSGAHKIAGSVRSQVAAEVKRQLSAALRQAAEHKHGFGMPGQASPTTKFKSTPR